MNRFLLGIVLGIAAFVALFINNAAFAQQMCAEHDNLVGIIGDQYDEHLRKIGVAGKYIVELYESNDGGFSITLTDTQGRSCLVISGDGWDEADAPRPGEPS